MKQMQNHVLVGHCFVKFFCFRFHCYACITVWLKKIFFFFFLGIVFVLHSKYHISSFYHSLLFEFEVIVLQCYICWHEICDACLSKLIIFFPNEILSCDLYHDRKTFISIWSVSLSISRWKLVWWFWNRTFANE